MSGAYPREFGHKIRGGSGRGADAGCDATKVGALLLPAPLAIAEN